MFHASKNHGHPPCKNSRFTAGWCNVSFRRHANIRNIIFLLSPHFLLRLTWIGQCRYRPTLLLLTGDAGPQTGSGNNYGSVRVGNAIPMAATTCPNSTWHWGHCHTLGDYRNSRWRPAKQKVEKNVWTASDGTPIPRCVFPVSQTVRSARICSCQQSTLRVNLHRVKSHQFVAKTQRSYDIADKWVFGRRPEAAKYPHPFGTPLHKNCCAQVDAVWQRKSADMTLYAVGESVFLAAMVPLLLTLTPWTDFGQRAPWTGRGVNCPQTT